MSHGGHESGGGGAGAEAGAFVFATIACLFLFLATIPEMFGSGSGGHGGHH